MARWFILIYINLRDNLNMCGICGIYNPGKDVDKELVISMANQLVHRGPDEYGYFFDRGIGLGHRRLSIIDLETGRQPIFNEDGSICTICNGEIYNYKELKLKLQDRGHIFKTQSDTEIIVHAYEEHGDEFVKLLNGDFSIAIWDKKNEKILLARDRLGIRPLYIFQIKDCLLFSSEIKSFLRSSDFNVEINPVALKQYLTLRYVLGNETLFQGVERVPPATILVYQKGRKEIIKYWELKFETRRGKREKEFVDGFYSLLNDSVRLRLMSDVPLGALLSGGVDSSSIVALMAKEMNRPVDTFCVGFGTDIDELDEARFISKYLMTNHHELIIKPDSYNFFPEIIWHMDEPLGDAIILPTYLLAKETSRYVKVVLTGEGIDEILGGYIHHQTMYYGDIYNRIVPSFLQKLNIRVLSGLPVQLLNYFFPYPALLGEQGKKRFIDYMLKLDNPTEAYLSLASVLGKEERDELLTPEFLEQGNDKWIYLDGEDIFNKVINTDLNNWLPNYTLFKQDRLTMANSLEGRVPFLDHRLVEFSAGLPIDMKIRGRHIKYILREAVKDLLPKKTVYRKKKAFYIPFEKCFDSGFNDFIRDYINEKNIKEQGIFNWDAVERYVYKKEKKELLENKRLMTLLIFQVWYDVFKNRRYGEL